MYIGWGRREQEILTEIQDTECCKSLPRMRTFNIIYVLHDVLVQLCPVVSDFCRIDNIEALAKHIRQYWIIILLVQVTDVPYGTKQLCKAILVYCRRDTQQRTWDILIKIRYFSSYIWNFCLQNGDYFVCSSKGWIILIVGEILCPFSLWRHQMEAFSALMSLCAGNSPVTGELPSQSASNAGFDVSLMWVRISN